MTLIEACETPPLRVTCRSSPVAVRDNRGPPGTPTIAVTPVALTVTSPVAGWFRVAMAAVTVTTPPRSTATSVRASGDQEPLPIAPPVTVYVVARRAVTSICWPPTGSESRTPALRSTVPLPPVSPEKASVGSSRLSIPPRSTLPGDRVRGPESTPSRYCCR